MLIALTCARSANPQVLLVSHDPLPGTYTGGGGWGVGCGLRALGVELGGCAGGLSCGVLRVELWCGWGVAGRGEVG